VTRFNCEIFRNALGKDGMTGAACGTGNTYPSIAPDFTSGFYTG